MDHTPLDGDLLDLCGIIGIAMMGAAPLLALLSLLIERRRVWLPIGTLVYVTLLYCVLNR